MKRLVEIRTYRLRPGTSAVFHDAFVNRGIPLVKSAGMDVVAFGFSPRQAAELLGSSVYLLGDPKVLLEQLDSVLQGSADKFTSDQVVSSLAMLERVASSGGAPSGTQWGLIEAIRSRLSQMQPAAKSWP